MREFADKTGGKWPIDLTVGAAMRVYTASDKAFDLFDPSAHELAQRLSDELPTFWQVLWLLVEPLARERAIDADKFGELMAADCLVTAQRQFFEEWRDFFLQLQQPHKATVLQTLARAQAKALELVRTKLASPVLTGLDARIDSAMSAQFETSFGTLQESLDRILGPTPSASSGS